MPTNSGLVGVQKVYAVRKGRKTGLFKTWEEVKELVLGYPGSVHKSFKSIKEAEDFLRAGGVPIVFHSNDPNSAGPSCNTSIAASSGTDPRPGAVSQTNNVGSSLASTASRIGGSTGFNSSLPTQASSQLPTHGSSSSKQAELVESLKARAAQVEPQVPVDPGTTYHMYFDGASRGNPGYAGCGTVIYEDEAGDKPVVELAVALPYGSTNNEAEYSGLVVGLHAAIALGMRKLKVRGDSMLVVQQVLGCWKVNKEHLLPFHRAACEGMRALQQCTVQHVLREFNKRADELSNLAVEQHFKDRL